MRLCVCASVCLCVLYGASVCVLYGVCALSIFYNVIVIRYRKLKLPLAVVVVDYHTWDDLPNATVQHTYGSDRFNTACWQVNSFVFFWYHMTTAASTMMVLM